MADMGCECGKGAAKSTGGGIGLIGATRYMNVMKTLSPDEVRRIALDAAEDAGYVGVRDADVVEVIDSLDEPSYTIRLSYDSGSDVPSMTMYSRLKRKIRDSLIARGDEHYPYVSYLGHEAWSRRQRA